MIGAKLYQSKGTNLGNNMVFYDVLILGSGFFF